MKTDRVNKWLTLAANIGVLIGLFFLIAELRQNTSISEMSFYMDRRAMANQFNEVTLDAGVSDIVTKSILAPEALASGEIIVLGSYLTARLNTWRVTYVQEELGFREPGSADTYLKLTVKYTFGNPAALAWWHLNRDQYPVEFRDSVDAALENVDPEFGFQNLSALQEEFRKLARDD